MSPWARGVAVAGSPAVRLTGIALVLAATLAAVLVATLGDRPQAPRASLAGPVTVNRALSTAALVFGDTVTAEVDVVSRDADVPAASVRVGGSYAPFTVVTRQVDRARLGGASLLRTKVTLQCVTRACLPPPGGRFVELRPAVVSYLKHGRPSRAVLHWGRLHVSSRFGQGAAGIGALDTAPPLDEHFARSPGVVRFALLAATVLLALLGTALVVWSLWPPSLRARRRWAKLSPLERSLLLVEAAAGHENEAERRRTLDRLALRLGEAQSPRLEQQTRALAWGEAAPGPDDLTLLAAEVRSTLNGKVRG